VPRSQSGWWKASAHDHQTIGSEVFCRYTTLGSVQSAGTGLSWLGDVMKRTVLPPR